MRESETNRRDLHICLLLALVTLGVFLPAAGFEFVLFDDGLHVTGNHIVQAGLTWDGIVWAFTSSASIFWHPITWLSHMLDCQLFGIDPRGHHVVNILWHTLNTALLYVVLRRLTGMVERSAIVAVLFALHPLHVESVAWVAQRKDLLSTFFWLLTIWAYLVYVNQPARRRYLLVCALFALGLLAKSMAVTLPLILLLLDVWPLRRLTGTPAPEPDRPQQSWRALVMEKIPLLAMSVATGLVTLWSAASGNVLRNTEILSVSFRLTNIPVSYLRYLGKTIWPDNLSVYYPTPASWPVALVIIALALIAAASWYCWQQRRERPYLVFGWSWYLISLLPVIGILKVGSHSLADRYTYLPLIGIFIAVVWLVADLLQRLSNPKPARFALVAAAGIACIAATSLQLQHWRNSLALFGHSLAVTRDNALAEYNYAAALVQAGHPAEAIPHYETVMKLRPGREDVHYQFAETLAAVQRFAEAEQHYAFVLQLNPTNTLARGHLGNVFFMQGKTAPAIAQYQRALQIDPHQDGILNNLGLALEAAGRFAEAEQQFLASLRLVPTNSQTHNNLAKLLLRLGRTEEAINHFTAAMELEPTAPEPVMRLAWLLATHDDARYRRGPIAVQLAKRTCELTQFQDPAAFDALAAALAETGQFKQAVETAQHALEGARAQKEDALASDIQKRLELYRAGKPYREAATKPATSTNKPAGKK